MICLVAVINGFVLFSTGMRIAFGFCVPVSMVCAIMSCWEIDIENFSAVINHVQIIIIKIIIRTRMINYWSRLLNGKHNKLAFILYRKMRASDGMHSNLVLKIQRIPEECGKPDLRLNQSCNHYCSKVIKSVLEAQYWSTKLGSSSKRLNYRLFKDSINLGSFFIKLPRSFFIHLGKSGLATRLIIKSIITLICQLIITLVMKRWKISLFLASL